MAARLVRCAPRAAQTATVKHAALSTNRLAFSATIHCLTGCAIGEILGLVIATQLRLARPAIGSLAISLVLAGIVAFPVNRWLIQRGQGHAVLGAHHH